MVTREATNDLWASGRGCLFVCLLSLSPLIPQFGKLDWVSERYQRYQNQWKAQTNNHFSSLNWYPFLVKEFFLLFLFHFGKTKIHNSFLVLKISNQRDFWRFTQDSELSLPRALGSVLGLETKIPQTMQCNQKQKRKRKARTRQNTFCSKSFDSVE